MPLDAEDAVEARRALEEWLRDRRLASIVVAAIDEQPGGGIDVALRLSSISGYRLIGLIQALVNHTLAVVEKTPVATAAHEYETLSEIKALLDGGRPSIS